MTVKRYLVCFLFIANLLIACAGASSEVDQAIKNDFKRYLELLSLVDDIEVEADNANRAAVEALNANDATYAVALRNNIIPKYKEFQSEIGRIHPTTNELLGLHRILIDRMRFMVDGLVELERGARTGDSEAIKEANMMFEFAKVNYKKWSEQLAELGKKYPNGK